MECSYQDFDKICRVCLKGEQLELEEFDQTLLQFYKHLISIPENQIAEGPTHICKGCRLHLQSIRLFQSQCLKNEAVIQLLCKSIIKETDLPLDINDYEITEPKDHVDLTIGSTTEDHLLNYDGATTMFTSEATSEDSLKTKPVNSELMPQHLKASVSDSKKLHEIPQEVQAELTDLPVKAGFKDTSTSKCDTVNRKIKSKNCNVNISNTNLMCLSCTLSYETESQLKAHFIMGCNKSFQLFMLHPNNFGSRRIFKCGICKRRFICNDYAKHLNEKHRGHTSQCSSCGIRFNRAHKLQAHVYKLHTHKKAFKCSVCCEQFITNKLLKNHIRETQHKTS